MLYGRLLGLNLDLAPISNATIGDGSFVAYDLEGWPHRYLYAIGFRDCPAGCLGRQYQLWEVTEAGVATLDAEWTEGEGIDPEAPPADFDYASFCSR